jgi:hypothetical protein
MYNARSKRFPSYQTALMEPPEQQGIGQGSPMVPRARVHHHALGLVKYYDLLIFIDKFQGDVFGKQVHRFRIRPGKLKLIPAFHQPGTFYLLPVEPCR